MKYIKMEYIDLSSADGLASESLNATARPVGSPIEASSKEEAERILCPRSEGHIHEWVEEFCPEENSSVLARM